MVDNVAGRPSGAPWPRPLEERLGIMQGRLVPSRTGALDCSPGPLWREEFARAGLLGLNHIELVAERRPDPSNPMWSEDGRRELVHIANASGVNLASVCANEALSTSFEDAEFAADLARRLDPLLAEVPLVVILPLLETSDLQSTEESAVASSVDLFAQRVSRHGARLVLELGVPAVEAKRFVEDVVTEDVGVCYDVGNATALGFDVPAELSLLGDHVRHVHAKDKDSTGQNVRFGAGNVEFDRVFAELAALAYDDLVTMEATRGADPVATADAHRAFLLSIGRPAGHTAEDER